MNDVKTLRIDPTAACKERVAVLKPFPKYLKRTIIKKFPEYDSANGGTLISNVMALRTADLRLTQIIEGICNVQISQLS